MRPSRSFRLLGTVAVTLVAIGLLACGSGGTGSAGDGDTLRIGSRNILDHLNPFNAFNHQSNVAFHAMFPTLVAYDAKRKIVPDWASSWESSADGKTWTFKVKTGKWSDGEPLTAEDAVWTGNTIVKYRDGAAGFLAGPLAHATEFEAPDPQTLLITYDRPVGNALAQLSQFYILPKHVWAKHEGANGRGLKAYSPAEDLPMVGAGPFILEKYDKRGLSLFRRNPSYYGGDKPKVAAVGVQFFTNGEGLVQAFRAGDVDYIDIRSAPLNALDQIEADPEAAVVREPGPQQTMMGLNSNQKKPENRELLDPVVREAFEHAIDRAEISEVVFNGFAKPTVAQVAPNSGEWSNTDLVPAEFDVEEGGRLLDDAGYKRGEDGVRVTPEGDPMEYPVITPTDTSYNINREFEIVQTAFTKMGVKLEQRALDEAATIEEISAPDGKYLTSDMFLWDYDGFEDPDFMVSVLTCAQRGSWNDPGYCNKEYDKLYEEQSRTLDPGKRKDLVWETQEIVNRDRPYIWISHLDLVSVQRNGWEGFEPGLEGRSKRAWTAIRSR